MVQTSSANPNGSVSCFTVYVEGQCYALPGTDADCIFMLGDTTPVPLVSAEIAGLTNLRGRVLTVVGLQRRIAGGSQHIRPSAVAIALRVNGEDFALAVDRVGDVIAISPEMRIETPTHLPPGIAQVTSGLYRVGDELLPVLDVAALMAGPTQRAEAPD
jgi:purine-binding chemotaxis protein CheW